MQLRYRKAAVTAPAPITTPITERLPSVQELRERLHHIEGQLAEADATIRTQSLAAVAGNEHARSLVTAANAKMVTLQSEHAMVSAALPQAKVIEDARHDLQRRRDAFLRNKHGWLLHLKQHVREQFSMTADHIHRLLGEGRHSEASRWWEGGRNQQDPPGVANIAHDIARQLVEPICKSRRAHKTGDPNRTHYSDEVDKDLMAEFIEDLLAEAGLPEVPDEIGAFVRKYHEPRR